MRRHLFAPAASREAGPPWVGGGEMLNHIWLQIRWRIRGVIANKGKHVSSKLVARFPLPPTFHVLSPRTVPWCLKSGKEVNKRILKSQRGKAVLHNKRVRRTAEARGLSLGEFCEKRESAWRRSTCGYIRHWEQRRWQKVFKKIF